MRIRLMRLMLGAVTLAGLPSAAAAQAQFVAQVGLPASPPDPGCVLPSPGGVSGAPISADGLCNLPGDSGGSAAGTADARQGHVQATVAAAKRFGGNDVPMSASGMAMFSEQVIFTPLPGVPDPGTIQVRLNLAFTGTHGPGAWFASSVIQGHAALGGLTIRLQSVRSYSDTGTTESDIFNFTSPAPGLLQTPLVTVPVNSPNAITLVLELASGAQREGSASAIASLAFPTGMDVFDLPPGFTVNAPGAFLANNRFFPTGIPAVVANAGPDQMIVGTSAAGSPVTLDGSLSFDPDGDPLTFSWTGPFGTTSGVSPVVALPIGTSNVTLMVSDGLVAATDTVAITVLDPARDVASIAVDPANPTIDVGQAQPFTATGTFRDGSTQVLPGGGMTPAPGLVAWWPGEDDANDIVGGNGGTLEHGATFGPGMVGQAFSVDGADDFVSVADSPGLSFGDGTSDRPFSIEGWVRPDTLTTTAAGNWIINKRDGASNDEWQLAAFDGGRLELALFDATPGDYIACDTSAVVLAPGTWRHIAATYDGSGSASGISIYVDGTAAACARASVGTYVAMSDGTAPVRIGMNGWSPNTLGWDGLIDELGIYDRALVAAEIQEIVTSGSADRCQAAFGCVAWSSSTAAATIDAGGVATGQSPGPTTITATSTAAAAIGGSTELTVGAVAPPDVVIDETTPQAVLDGLINPPACVIVVGTTRTTLVMPNLMSIGNCLTVSENSLLSDVDLTVGGRIRGDLTISNNPAASSLTVETPSVDGSVTIVDNGTISDGSSNTIVVGEIGGHLTISGNRFTSPTDTGRISRVDGDTTISDNLVTISDGSSNTIVFGEVESVGGDAAIRGNSVTDSDGSSNTIFLVEIGSVSGDLTISGNTSTGEQSLFDAAGTSVEGNVRISTRGTGRVSGSTGGLSTSVTLANGSATMNVVLPEDAFATPVSFTIESLGNAGSLTGPIVDGSSNTVLVEEVAAYRFTFGIATLNQDATLTFDIDVATLDAAGQASLLDAVASNSATLGVQGDAPGSLAQVFDVCTTGQAPTAGGCVQVVGLDAAGLVIPAGDATVPTIVRFTGVTGHFSTFAVVIVRPIPDTTAPVISGLPAPIAAPATSASGSIITYAQPTALDDRDGLVPVTCTPASGASFPVGTTTVSCDAVDAAGNRTSASFTVTVTPLVGLRSADLRVTSTASPNSVTLGSQVTYTITVGNNGPGPATDVRLTNTVSTKVPFVSATTSQGHCDGIAGLLTCHLGTLAHSATAAVTLIVVPQATGTLTDKVSAASSTTDPSLANNRAIVTTVVR